MRSDTIISVENLGKRYRIRHQADRQRYRTLRDVLMERFRSLLQIRKSRIASRKSVEDFWALKDVSFEVKQGEVVGIIGRNGAGKSTLLKILSRITEPTEGRVRIKGRVASLLEVGTGFHAELTGRENVFLNGAILGMTRAEIKEKFDEIVAFAEVERFLDTPVKRYSSGMYVRLAFAVAAHLEPQILIVDEVLAVGDASYQEKCIGQMRRLAASGRTVLFVSHNMGFVLTLCRRVLHLDSGRVRSEGPTDDVITSYLARKRDGDTSEAPPSQNGVTVVAVCVNGRPGNEIGEIPFAKPFEISLLVRCDQRLDGVRIQMEFYNNLENKVSMINTREAGPGSFNLNGDSEIKIAVTHNALMPDSYRLDFQLKGGPECPVVCHVPNLWHFIVSERVLPGGWGPYTREHGVVYLESRIEKTPA